MNIKSFIRRHPVASYFTATFVISWLGAFILVAPKLFSGQSIPKMDGILMFPIMLTGPASAGIILTALTEGKTGLRNLMSRIGKWKVPVRWYLIALLIPPCLIITTLLFLKNFVSSSVLNYKYIPYIKPSHDVLYTLYWWKGLWNYKAEFAGDFSIWPENKNHGNDNTKDLREKDFLSLLNLNFGTT